MLNERELHARYEIMVETYNKTVNVEGQLMVLMANRYILPAAFEYQKQVAQSVSAVKAAGGKSVEGKKLLDEAHQADRRVQAAQTDKLQKALEHEGNGRSEKHAKHFRDAVIPAMAALRETGDALEAHHPARARGRSPRIARCSSSSRVGSQTPGCGHPLLSSVGISALGFQDDTGAASDRRAGGPGTGSSPLPPRHTLPAPTIGSNLPLMVGAVIYVRVSTKEQTENLSLPTQLRACEEYCRRQGYEILERSLAFSE